MYKGYRFFAGVLGVLLSLQFGLVHADEYSAPTARRGAVLVVPRRPTLVQVGFDITYLRPVVLVCFETGPGLAAPALSVWDSNSGAWRRMGLDHFRSGSFLTFNPKKAIIVGTEAELPASIAGGTTWAGETVRIANLSIDNVFNILSDTMNFSGAEWRWLAKRYGLRIRDLNVERRRWGRYGPPGGSSRPTRAPIRVPAESQIPPRPMVIDEEPLAPAAAENDFLRSLSGPQPVQ
jgi:hypothetical protein